MECNQIYDQGIFPIDTIDSKINDSSLSEELKAFLIVIEDKNFYHHFGVSFRGVLRAFIQNLKAGKIVQGGSTITQQLARSLLNDNRRTYSRKIKELIKCLILEFTFSKQQILNYYLNSIYFGNGLRGIKSASSFYFSKNVIHLSQVEHLILLSLLRSPNYYLKNTRSLNLRFLMLNWILFKNEKISNEQFEYNQSLEILIYNNPLSPDISTKICYKSHYKTKKQF